MRGVKINSKKIARGVYDMIPTDEKACMVFGMLPAKFMYLLEKLVREKVTLLVKEREEWLEVGHLTDKEVEDEVKEITSETVHKVSVEMIKISTENGICKV